MKTIKYIFLILIIAGGSSSCENEDELSIESLEESPLIGCWTNSYEEGDGVYRGCQSQSFPASRFRQVFEFRADFTCDYLVLASNDAHYFQEGRWNFNEERKEVSIMDLEGNALMSFVIIDANQESITIRVTSQNKFIGG